MQAQQMFLHATEGDLPLSSHWRGNDHPRYRSIQYPQRLASPPEQERVAEFPGLRQLLPRFHTKPLGNELPIERINQAKSNV